MPFAQLLPGFARRIGQTPDPAAAGQLAVFQGGPF
jgi:hypothetical protein